MHFDMIQDHEIGNTYTTQQQRLRKSYMKEEPHKMREGGGGGEVMGHPFGRP